MSGDRHNVTNLDTVKKQINYNELSKGELLDIIAYLQSELEARDVLIAILKNEKSRGIYQQARYGHLPGRGADPFQALQRDSETLERSNLSTNGVASSPCNEKSLSNVDALRPIYDSQLTQLENLIATQKRTQQKLRDQLSATEKAYRKVFLELEEARKSHERDAAQGDDVLVHLEKERERLTSELEHERLQRHKLEKEVQKLRQLYEDSQLVHDIQAKVATKMICQYIALYQSSFKSSDISTCIRPPQELSLNLELRESISNSQQTTSPLSNRTSLGDVVLVHRHNEKELSPLHNGISETKAMIENVALESSADVTADNGDEKCSPKLKTPVVSTTESTALDAANSVQYFVSKMSIPSQTENTLHSPVEQTSSLFSQDSPLPDNALTSPAFLRNTRLKPEPPIRRTPEQSYIAKALATSPMTTMNVSATTTPTYSTPTTVNFAVLQSQNQTRVPAMVPGGGYAPHRVLPQPHLTSVTTSLPNNVISSPTGAKSSAHQVSAASSGDVHQVVYATPRKILPQQPASAPSSGVVGIIRPIQYAVSHGAGISNVTPQQQLHFAPASTPSVMSARLKLPTSASTTEDIALNNGTGPINAAQMNLRKFPSHHHAVPVNSVRGPHPGTYVAPTGGPAPPGPQHFMTGHNSVQLLPSAAPSSGSPSIPQGGAYVYHQLSHATPLSTGGSHSNSNVVASPAIPSSTSQHR